MTYRDIITSINYKIENSNLERFSISHIIDELNNTYRDLAHKTDIFETHEFMQLFNDQNEYVLPSRIYRPTRATYRGNRIDFKSQEEMDINLPGWEATQTAYELEYLVYNNLSDRLVTAYPRLTDLESAPSTESDVIYLGQLSNVSDEVNQFVYLNTVTGAKYVSSDPRGTISDLNLTEVMTIYGVYLPPKVEEFKLDSDIIYIDEVQVNALIYGTAGNLLFTSGRTEDAQKASNFMKLYGIDETEVAAIRKKDFTGGFRNTSRNTNYRTPFNR